ncbi:MAG: hypothetical protein AAF682_20600 [Planctomycetota bacterium]
MYRFLLPCAALFALVSLPTPSLGQGIAPRSAPVPNRAFGGVGVSGLIETTFADPDWVLASSDVILRADLCAATLPCEPSSWYDRVEDTPCYPELTRYWKLDPLAAGQASAFTLAGLGVGGLDGLYLRGDVEFQLYNGADTSTPVGALMTAPQFVSVDVWQPFACDGFEPGTFFVNGGAGALDGHSIELTEFSVAPIEGGVRARAGIPASLAAATEVLVDGVPARDVVVRGSATFGYTVFFTPPPHAAGMVDATMSSGGPAQVIRRIDYTADVARGIEATRRGVEVYHRELLEHDPDGFVDLAPQAGAIGEVALHGLLRRASDAVSDPAERDAVNAALEGFLAALRDGIASYLAADGQPLPNAAVPALRAITRGQALHQPQETDDDVVLMTLATGTLVLTSSAVPVAGGEVSGGRIVLPAVDKVGASYSETVLADDAQGWAFTVEVDPVCVPACAKGVQLRDVTFRAAPGEPVQDVARLLSLPTVIADVDGVELAYQLDESNLSHVYIHESVVASPPVAAPNPPVDLTEWILTAAYRVNLDGSPHLDNVEAPALVVRQSFALSAAFDDATPEGCVKKAQAFPRASFSVSVPPGTVTPPAVGRVRMDHRLGFAPQATEGSLPADEYVAGFFDDRDRVLWWLPGCVPLPLWFNLFDFADLSAFPDELAAATVAPLTEETLAFSPLHSSFELHHRHPDQEPPWSGFGVDKPLEVPNGPLAGIGLRWAFGADYAPDFGSAAGGGSLLPQRQSWVFGLSDATFPEDPTPDFETVLRADLAGGAADVTLAEKVLFVGCWQTLLDPRRQYETLGPGFSFRVGPADTPCESATFVEEFGAHAGLQRDLGGASHAPLLNTLQALQEAFVDCTLEGPSLLPDPSGADCDRVSLNGLIPSATPFGVTAGATTISFSVSSGTAFDLGPNTMLTALGLNLAEPETPGGAVLQVDFSPPIRALRGLPLVVADAVGPAALTITPFSGGGSLGSIGASAAVPSGAPYSEVLVDVDPGATFDSVTISSDNPALAFGIGGFLVCSGALVPGDLDHDGDVDADDLDVLAACAAGPGVAVGFQCRESDLDGDGDVDCDDVVLLDGLAGGFGTLSDGDADGVADACDNCPATPNALQGDCDLDGVGDACAIALGVAQDCNTNGVADACDISTGFSLDCNANGVPDECEPDCNSNGVPDECDILAGTSTDCAPLGVPGGGNGIPDECEPDCNTNGTPDSCDIADGTSADCNGNGVPDDCDISLGTSTDCNANGVPDECELVGHDCNGNGVLDECDIAAATSADCDANGYPDECQPDCNADGVPDLCDLDCNGNLVSDTCDIALGVSLDCNANGVPDACDLALGTSLDCNANGIPDACDVASGFSGDCNANGIPDECELATGDCNGNGVLDSCDIALGVSPDCNTNGVPDECDVALGTSPDCNANGVPDECDVALGTSPDCNSNGIPDECDVALAISPDCNANGIPDECDLASGFSLDCNGNGIPDDCDIASGFSLDCNANGIPDACDLVSGFSPDCNANGIPDECDIASGFSTDCNLSGVPDECEALAVFFVDPAAGGSGAGTSWGDAFPDLQSAIDAANSCVGLPERQIWVAAGTYLPTAATSGDPRTVTFTLADGVELYGGFAGGETSLAQADPDLNVTVLSADLNGNDLPGFVNTADNAYHVVSAANVGATAVLDGFTLRGGAADGPFPSNTNGGGITLDNASPTISRCRIESSFATRGGGLYAEGTSTPTVTDCVFDGNLGSKGGGVTYEGGAAVLVGCTMSNNQSTIDGGGLLLRFGVSGTLTGCTFDANSAIQGGGISCDDATLTASSCSFTGNDGTTAGGGIYVIFGGSADLTDCTFTSNSSQRGGGYFSDASSGTLDGCTFSLNTATLGGAGVNLASGSTTDLTDCDFDQNDCNSLGGGGFNELQSLSTYTGCTFSSNTATRGGGLANSDSTVELTLCVFDANTAVQSGGGVDDTDGNLSTLTDCSFTNNIGNTGGGMHMLSSGGSLTGCTFAGNQAGSTGGGLMNLGGSAPAVTGCDFVMNTASTAGALYNAASSPTITGCTFTQNSATVDAGAAGNLTNAAPVYTDCTFDQNDCGSLGGALINTSGATSTLNGCDFTANSAASGGGVFSGSPLTMADCTFDGNTGTSSGGGFDVRGTDAATIDRCSFTTNDAPSGGGVFASVVSSPAFADCVFQDNTASNGGAVFNGSNGTPSFRNCNFLSNTVTGSGGCIFEQGSGETLVRNCLMTGNFASSQGGCISIGFSGNLAMLGTSLVSNQGQQGGGIFLAGTVSITSSILWGNQDGTGAGESAQIRQPSGTTQTDFVDYSTVLGWTGALGGTGNDGLDPLFVNLAGGDFHLTLASPARDTGDPGFVAEPGELDLDGEPRFTGPGVDRGVDEFLDCDASGMPDYLEIQLGLVPDCNGNGVPDSCDLAAGTSTDFDGNSVPDECQVRTIEVGTK